MPTPTRLVPLRSLSAVSNLRIFIDNAKRLAPCQYVDFQKNVWTMTERSKQKGKRGGTSVNFAAWNQPRPSVNVNPQFLPEPFLSFSKAHILRVWDHSQKVCYTRDFVALRAISHVLGKQNQVEPQFITPSVLTSAAALVRAKYSKDGAHGIGTALQLIATTLDENYLCRVPLQWKNPNTAPENRSRLGEDFDARKENKLPSRRVLMALGQAYRLAVDPEDVIYTSMTALMLGAPDRPNEVVSMLVDCESPTRGDGRPGYSLRWWPSKGTLPMLKPVPTAVQDLVKDAIARIKRETENARAIAKYYEIQINKKSPRPTRLYLPESLEYLRQKEFLTKAEIYVLLHGVSGKLGDKWCAARKIKEYSVTGKKHHVHKFKDVEKALLNELPSHFPYSDNTKRWKCSELLFTMLKYSNTVRRPFVSLVVSMDRTDLNYRLNGTKKTSIFRNVTFEEFDENDNAPLKVRPSQFRHLLNHIAHTTGEMTEIDIDLWSGRRRRGGDYNHMTSEEISRKHFELTGSSIFTLPAKKVLQPIQIYARSEFSRLGIKAGHTTDFGYCVHDFSATPCQKHEECLNCDEQFCVKGDTEKKQALIQEQHELSLLVANAQASRDANAKGADRWLQYQQNNLDRADELLAILNDPRVPYGAIVRPQGQGGYSRIQHAREIASDSEISGKINYDFVTAKIEAQFSRPLARPTSPPVAMKFQKDKKSATRTKS